MDGVAVPCIAVKIAENGEEEKGVEGTENK